MNSTRIILLGLITSFISACGLDFKHDVGEVNFKVDVKDTMNDVMDVLQNGIRGSGQEINKLTSDLSSKIDDLLGRKGKAPLHLPHTEPTIMSVNLERENDIFLVIDQDTQGYFLLDLELMTLQTPMGIAKIVRNFSSNDQIKWWFVTPDSDLIYLDLSIDLTKGIQGIMSVFIK